HTSATNFLELHNASNSQCLTFSSISSLLVGDSNHISLLTARSVTMSVSATTPASDTAIPELTPAQKKKEARRVILSSYLGSSIEFYDFLLYASASSLFFPTVFINNLVPLVATIRSEEHT